MNERAAAPAPRLVFRLSGTASALRASVRARLPETLRVHWIGGPEDDAPHAIRLIGEELDGLIVDASGPVDANRLGAAIGAIRGGGALLWLTPHDRPPPPPSVQRAEHILGLQGIDVTSMDAVRFGPFHGGSETRNPALPANAEQAAAQRAITAGLAEDRAVVVIRADRGRGKSAALGLACADALHADAGSTPLLVTSTQPAGRTTLKRHAHARSRHLGIDPARLRFVAPEALPRVLPGGRLIVDEAASLPSELLDRLVTEVPRLVLATTEHGYEGSGQHFRLRILEALTRARSGELRVHELTRPLRYPLGDPVERLGDAVLLLRRPVATAVTAGTLGPAGRLSATELRTNEDCLRSVYDLLATAHYRTRPSDLFRLLDDPAVSVWRSTGPGGTSACALTLAEGGLSEAVAYEMVAGRRRPRGHLGPGVLATRLGLPDGAQAHSVRIHRIAVDEPLRRSGQGRALLETIAADARARGAALLTSSFTATPALERFWDRCGFRVLWRGANSAFVARPLSSGGVSLVEGCVDRIRNELPGG